MLKVKAWALVGLMAMVVASCSWTDAAKLAVKAVAPAADSGISADVQNGDRKNDVSIGDDKSSESTGPINNSHDVKIVQNKVKRQDNQTVNAPKADKVVINQGASSMLVFALCVLCLAAWVAPSPKECLAYVKAKFADFKARSVARAEAERAKAEAEVKGALEGVAEAAKADITKVEPEVKK